MDILFLAKIAPLITAIVGIITIVGTYFSKEYDKYTQLEEEYFKKVLADYIGCYNNNNNINPINFLKKRYNYNDYYIPPYIFYLIKENKKEDLHKVLISDYDRGIYSELNCFLNMFKKFLNVLRIIGLISFISFIYYIVVTYIILTNNELQINVSNGNIKGAILFTIIMFIFIGGIILLFMYAIKLLIIDSMKSENKYTDEEKYMIIQIENKKKIYDKKIKSNKNFKEKNKKINFFPNSFHQWIRIIIGIGGIFLSILAIAEKITFDKMATWATLVGFIGYIIDVLISNVEERKKQLKNKQFMES